MDFTCTEKNQTGYVVSTELGQTLQQAPKIPESAKIMKNQATEPIVVYLLLRTYLSTTDIAINYNIPCRYPAGNLMEFEKGS